MNQVIGGPISLKADLNFVASYVKYEIRNHSSNKTFVSSEVDPYGAYIWSPEVEDKGIVYLKVTAYDDNGFGYPCQPISASVNITKKLGLIGREDNGRTFGGAAVFRGY